MNDQHINALLSALQRQRDAALNSAGQLEAQLELALAEIAELKAPKDKEALQD